MSIHANIERLRRGKRWWAAELALRAVGLAMLACCTLVARGLGRLAGSAHHGARLEFVVAAITVLTLWTGLALTLEGPGLFRLMPKPPRALF